MNIKDSSSVLEAVYLVKGGRTKQDYLDEMIARYGQEHLAEHLNLWECRWKLEKRWGDDQASTPYETIEDIGNLLTTAGAGQLWSGLTSAGLGTPWNSTNAQIVVGDNNTAATNADTDMGATAGTKLNASDAASATNATPIVITATFSPTPVTGQVVVCSGFSGAGAAAINQTFEITAASGAALTLLNSAGTGSITVTGGLVKPINKYAMVTGAPNLSTNTAAFTSTFATINANFAWAEWGLRLGAATTNTQAAPPSKLLNHAISSLGTKTSASSWAFTVTLSLA